MSEALLSKVIFVLSTTLGIQDQAWSLNADTHLLDSLPELDSMAIVELIVALEDQFDIEFDEDDVTAEVFTSIGSLAAFIDTHYS